MKKVLKVLFVAIVAFSVVFGVAQPVSFAATPDVSIIDGMKDQDPGDMSKVSEIGGKVVNAITTIAIVISVIVLTVIGIKYIIGSTQEKAEYKKSLIPLVVGILVIIFASTIVKVLFSIKA